jgi:hypothetical protein
MEKTSDILRGFEKLNYRVHLRVQPNLILYLPQHLRSITIANFFLTTERYTLQIGRMNK